MKLNINQKNHRSYFLPFMGVIVYIQTFSTHPPPGGNPRSSPASKFARLMHKERCYRKISTSGQSKFQLAILISRRNYPSSEKRNSRGKSWIGLNSSNREYVYTEWAVSFFAFLNKKMFLRVIAGFTITNRWWNVGLGHRTPSGWRYGPDTTYTVHPAVSSFTSSSQQIGCYTPPRFDSMIHSDS